ncbi:NAD-dependent epimerase/dehydratase family protein [Patescibacteria group bacterium]|nr:NAD-dependent epimerase/dehydratase family protein [Patescibacteria group bacterium]MBU1501120.1 NAD-dependent epimerase/dehydratase family protein [Patescibacteria group bacterium]MBU2081007.1 NAD-dependent epimerase/dehydratase family protein [Patescibacteria group bacterium]MBU2124099.1 NAD-dependent epimerase/dehydratase family protein [Patescibacteria group bacterium]MBU2194954.1 NAD-dependent epimerase/dehydratase family protein [Patescibacteria group bacterium]
MKKILVTGAGGFVGVALVRVLERAGSEVHVTVRKTPDKTFTKWSDKVSIHKIDLLDKNQVGSLFKRIRPDVVYHLAAVLPKNGDGTTLTELYGANVLIVQNVLDAVADSSIEAAVFMGSCLEYGPSTESSVESDRCHPESPYGITKLSGTLLAQAAAKNQNLPIIVCRLFTPFGPGSRPGRFVTEVFEKAKTNQPILLPSKLVSRDFIYINDVVRFLVSAPQELSEEKIGNVFNLGSGKSETLLNFTKLVFEEFKASAEINFDTNSTSIQDTGLWQASMEKTTANFSWRPAYTLEEGIQETARLFPQMEG